MPMRTRTTGPTPPHHRPTNNPPLGRLNPGLPTTISGNRQMTWDDFKQQDLSRDEKIPAADIDADAGDADIAVSPTRKPSLWRRIMSTLKQKRRDDYMRKKDQQRALTIVRNDASAEVTSVPSAVASYSRQEPHPFASPEPIDATYTEVPKTQPATSPRRNWLSGSMMIIIGTGLAAVGLY